MQNNRSLSRCWDRRRRWLQMSPDVNKGRFEKKRKNEKKRQNVFCKNSNQIRAESYALPTMQWVSVVSRRGYQKWTWKEGVACVFCAKKVEGRRGREMEVKNDKSRRHGKVEWLQLASDKVQSLLPKRWGRPETLQRFVYIVQPINQSSCTESEGSTGLPRRNAPPGLYPTRPDASAARKPDQPN